MVPVLKVPGLKGDPLRTGTVLFLLFWAGVARAADQIDYRVTGQFIIDAIRPPATKTSMPEVWYVNARRVMRENKPPLLRFDFSRTRLTPADAEKWAIEDVFVFHYNLGSGKALFKDGSFIFDFGEESKTHIQIDCNPDGTLKDISGYSKDRAGATTVKFRLSSERERLVVVANNSYKTSTYSYQKRVPEPEAP